MSVDVNYIAVLVAGIISMVVGYVWYGPAFGKTWMKLSGIVPQNMGKEEQNKMMKKNMSIMFVGALVMAYVLFHSIAFATGFMQVSGAAQGMMGGFWIWLGFIVPVMLGKVLWEGKSWKLFILDSSYYLVVLVVNGALLASWM